MLLNDSQMTMGPLCLELLFTPVDYILMICLTKWLSWLVGVNSRACSSICIYIIISLISFCFEGFIHFLAVTWALGLKKCLKSRGHWHNTKRNSHWMLACLAMRVSRSSWTLLGTYHGGVQRSRDLKPQWDGFHKCWDGSHGSCS